jgi:hypothetical protein
VRNALDRIKLRQANRLVQQGGVIDREELMRIDADDIRRAASSSGGADRRRDE